MITSRYQTRPTGILPIHVQMDKGIGSAAVVNVMYQHENHQIQQLASERVVCTIKPL